MDEAERTEAAHLLAQAYLTREALPPLIETYGEVTLDDAYAVQQAQVGHWLAGGAVLRGHKVGLTSAAMQRHAVDKCSAKVDIAENGEVH